MAGLKLTMSGYGGAKPAGAAPNYGSAASYASGVTPTSATAAAFGPGFTSPTPTAAQVLAPNDGFGIAVWAGVVAIGLLVFVRYSLPR